jgi:tRNA-specific 2-thiouridylase
LGGGKVKIVLDEPVKGVSPGQSSVFYDENGCVVGGGIIC